MSQIQKFVKKIRCALKSSSTIKIENITTYKFSRNCLQNHLEQIKAKKIIGQVFEKTYSNILLFIRPSVDFILFIIIGIKLITCPDDAR